MPAVHQLDSVGLAKIANPHHVELMDSSADSPAREGSLGGQRRLFRCGSAGGSQPAHRREREQ
jgi:hypothetical protein